MRNLKKILALVLALVMSVSVMSVAGAEFKDAESINDKYVDAVEVLAGFGIFTGYKDAEGNFTFNPTGTITRKEVAALIYRIDTADVANERVDIYSDWNKFEDVPAGSWYAGYVNYCANAGWIKGRSDTSFDPEGNVTGYEVLAMILRVIGYDKEGEYSGSMWREHVFADATKLGILNGMSNKDTLGADASRQLVAELLFRAIKDVPQVKYTLLTGYVSTNDIFGMGTENETVGYSRFGLLKKYDANKHDDWGRPYGAWEYVTGKTDALGKLVEYDVPGTENFETALDKKTVAMDHCCVYDLVKTTKINVYTNGVLTTNVAINPYSTTQIFGGQGVTLEIYKDELVIIDTYLAEVTKAVKQTTDKAGHIKVYAHNDFQMYANNIILDNGEYNEKGTWVELKDEKGNLIDNLYTEYYNEETPAYEVGKFLLVNYNEATGDMFITGEPKEFTGKQTFIWRNSDFHTVEGEKYDDHANYVLDKAGIDKKDQYVWFFDGENNVIGSTNVPTEIKNGQYVVVLGIYWKVIDFENAYAYARVQELKEGSEPRYVKINSVDGKKMMYAGTAPELDKTTGKVDIKKLKESGLTFQNGYVYTTYQYNLFTTEHMYEIVKGNFETGLDLKVVGNHMDTATIADGYSEVAGKNGGADVNFFTDNETQYFFYENGTLKFYKGYDNLPAELLECTNIDRVTHDKEDLFVDLIYAESAVEPEEKEEAVVVKTTYDFVYFTNNTHHYELGKNFILTGVVNSKGATELKFNENQFGDAETTWATLEALQELYRNHLCKVTMDGGIVVAIEPVDAKLTANKAAAQFIEDGEYVFDNKGVLLINDKKLPLNCNTLTLVINDEGKAEYLPVEVLAENLNGVNFFVVYGNTTRLIEAIYITDIEAPATTGELGEVMADVKDAYIDLLGEKTSEGKDVLALGTTGQPFTYTVRKDATVAEINDDTSLIRTALVNWFKADSNIGVALNTFGTTYDVTVTTGAFDADLKAEVTFTVQVEGKTFFRTVKVQLGRAAK